MRIRPTRFSSSLAAILLAVFLMGPAVSVDEPDWEKWETTQDGFVPLFNGEDLDGWVNVNGAPSTYYVRDGMLVTSGAPYGVLRTDRQYENFILELEYRHIEERGNSGLFLWSDPLPARGAPFTRSIEVQVLDGRNTENYTSHGDIFSIWGATMKPRHPHPNGWERALPTERRANPAGEWNHYRVIAYDGEIKLAVNGKIVTEAYDASPRKGYICLEAEGAETHFRNLRIRELPSTDPAAEDIADEARGFRNLYNGVDLTGWRVEPGQEDHWRANDWILSYDGASEDNIDLWTEESFGDFVLVADWRWTGEPQPTRRPVILPDGNYAVDEEGERQYEEVPDAGDSGIFVRGSTRSQVNIWCWPVGSGEVWGYRADTSLPDDVRAAVTPRVNADRPIGQWNRFVITMKGEHLTVELNGETVIEKAHLPDVAERGPIGLQDYGYAIDFANLYIKELD